VTWKKHAVIAAACLLLIVSPIGAPAIGILVTSLCPVALGPEIETGLHRVVSRRALAPAHLRLALGSSDHLVANPR